MTPEVVVHSQPPLSLLPPIKEKKSNYIFMHRHFQNSDTLPLSFYQHTSTPIKHTGDMTNLWRDTQPQGLGTIEHPTHTSMRTLIWAAPCSTAH